MREIFLPFYYGFKPVFFFLLLMATIFACAAGFVALLHISPWFILLPVVGLILLIMYGVGSDRIAKKGYRYD